MIWTSVRQEQRVRWKKGDIIHGRINPLMNSRDDAIHPSFSNCINHWCCIPQMALCCASSRFFVLHLRSFYTAKKNDSIFSKALFIPMAMMLFIFHSKEIINRENVKFVGKKVLYFCTRSISDISILITAFKLAYAYKFTKKNNKQK